MNVLRSTSLLSTSCAVLLLSACGSDGDNFSYDPIPYNQLPADAVVIDELNAAEIAGSAYSNVDDDPFATSGSSTPDLATKSTLDQVTEFSKSRTSDSNDMVLAATYEEPCDSGSIVYVENVTTGSITFKNCQSGGITTAGYFSASATFNPSTYYYTTTVDGGFTISGFGESVSMGLHVSESGYQYTEFDYTYSTDMDFAITGIPDIGGFRFETVENITGDSSSSYPDGGRAIIYGADNTKLQITFTSTGMNLDIDLDDGNGYVAHPDNPISYY